MKAYKEQLQPFLRQIRKDRLSVYAAQSAFFLMLSMFPVLMLLMTLVRVTPVTQSDVMHVIYDIFPKTIRGTMIALVDEVYRQTGTTISLSILVTIWSAGKGVMAIANGLNSILGIEETRNYFFVRIRAAGYTVLFVMAMILSLVFLGFGNSISLLVNQYIPVLRLVTDLIIKVRAILMLCVIVIVTTVIYLYLPNEKREIRQLIPGAIFTAFGWVLLSFVFSVYMDVFKGFSNMYGSLTTIILIMLWLYFCMYIILLGDEINVLMMEHLDIKN